MEDAFNSDNENNDKIGKPVVNRESVDFTWE